MVTDCKEHVWAHDDCGNMICVVCGFKAEMIKLFEDYINEKDREIDDTNSK